MGKTKHTPKPWKIIPRFTMGNTDILIEGKEGNNRILICKLLWHGNDFRDEANAQLIAAAPELLETCKALLGILTPKQYTRQFPNVYKKAKAIIAKAEGRSNHELLRKHHQEGTCQTCPGTCSTNSICSKTRGRKPTTKR